jgi:branched-chain amino acid transport system permease protein
MLTQFIINGLITGAIYSLVALGFAIVYNTTRIFHMAYAILYTTAPYLLYTFFNQLGLPIGVGVLIAILGTILLSLLVELLVYQPLEKRNRSLNVIMISSIGVMIIVINTIALIYGNDTKIIHSQISKSISLRNIIITYNQLIQFTVSIILIALFMFFLKFSKFGIKTRAMRDNVYLCKLFAMDISKFRLLLFALSGFFAAVGGILVGYDVGVDPYVGMPMLLNAFVAIIIGGEGKFYSPIVGGFLIGLLQALVVWKFSANWQDAVTFTLLILFLLFRPQGLFGEKMRLV